MSTPALTLPRLHGEVPSSVTSLAQAAANARLCRFLIEAGVVREGDLPDTEGDALKACETAIDRWLKRQLGPLKCLQPRVAANVLDEDRHQPALRHERAAPYAFLDLYWCEYQEKEWAVGPRLQALDTAMPGLGQAVLQVLREQSRYAYPLFTPDIACDVSSYLYWQGEEDEEAALDMMCEEGDADADREAMRDEMVTRAMLDEAYPAWARRWPAHRDDPRRGRTRRAITPAQRQRLLRTAKRTLGDAGLRVIAADALALSVLVLDDHFVPDMDGEFVGFGGVLSWHEADPTTRIYDDLLNLAHQAEFCDRMGEALIPLDEPRALADCFERLRGHLQAIALIDRLIHALSAGH